jgi:hypothetical protein
MAFDGVPVLELVEPADAQSGVEKARAPTMLRATAALRANVFIYSNVVLQREKVL